MRFLLDQDVPIDVSYSLVQLGHQVVLLREVLDPSAEDAQVIEYAFQNGFEPTSTSLKATSEATSDLTKIAKTSTFDLMSTMNVSLPDSLKDFVDEQVAQRGFGSVSEYVRELIRKERDRSLLRNLLLEGAGSAPAGLADASYFDGLRRRVRKHARA